MNVLENTVKCFVEDKPIKIKIMQEMNFLCDTMEVKVEKAG